MYGKGDNKFQNVIAFKGSQPLLYADNLTGMMIDDQCGFSNYPEIL